MTLDLDQGAMVKIQNCSTQTLNDLEIDLLLEAILQHYGYDFRHYAKASLKRRVQHRMSLSKIKTVSELQSLVLHDKKIFNEFLKDMSVTVTEIYRDPFVYKELREFVIPVLKTYPYIKIWIAGCATGEEVYSLAILLHEEDFLSKTQIYATDYNRNSLKIASEGLYDQAVIDRGEENYIKMGGKSSFKNYYSSMYNSCRMKSYLKDRVTFSHHNLVCDGVFGEMNLIICRNVLIYFNKILQDHVLSLFSDSLVHRGFLCLGTKESVEFSKVVDKYDTIHKKAKIYRIKPQLKYD